MSKILVTGATGTIGKALTQELLHKKANFVAGVRDVEKAKNKIPSNSLVSFDFANPSTFEKATENVDRVFLLGPPLVTNLDELLKPFIDHLKRKNILNVTYVAALGLDQVPELPFHRIVTDKLKNDGFKLTILKPSFFAQNFKNYEGENILQRGIIYSPAGAGKVAFIDVQDIARVAAAVLTSDGHAGKSYELTGPELLSYFDAAEVVSEVLGKKVSYINPSPQEYKETLKSAGAPDFIAPYMISVYSMIANNIVNTKTNEVEKLTGRKPTSLKDALRREFAS